MRSIFRVGDAPRTEPPPEISPLRYEISTSPQGGGKFTQLSQIVTNSAPSGRTILSGMLAPSGQGSGRLRNMQSVAVL